MANWNKRSTYKKDTNQTPQNLTPWEQTQKTKPSSGDSDSSTFGKNQATKKTRKKRREKKVVSMEEKLPRLKEMRRKKMLRRLISVIFIFSFAILMIVYFVSPYSRIAEISVAGTNEVTDQAVIDASGLKSGEPIWSNFFERNKIVKHIQKDVEQVKSVKLKFAGINSFKLVIKEYKTVAYLAKDNEYHNILENGKIVKESRKVSIGNPPIFVNFKEGPALDEMILQYSQLNNNIKNSISEVEFKQSESDDYLITLNMNDSNQVVASIPTFADKMAYYPDIVRKLDGKKGIINLEVGGYYSPFPEKTPTQ